ncbi:MAG: SGNH/GDSL hydrolase family protein, partial [Planctomycetaceae bacterium]|nr:SGNH/GDSL hydrolase family protein [Planctomycetaceae bacterium]
RVLVLGDESVFGSAIPDDRTLTVWLQKQLQKHSHQQVEVINGGLPGSCPLLAWLHYEHQLRDLQPDLVILHFDMSDVADDAAYRRYLVLNDKSDGPPASNPDALNPSTTPAAADRTHVLHPSLSTDGPRCIHPLISCRQQETATPMKSLCRYAVARWLISKARSFAEEDASISRRAATEQTPLAWIADSPPDLRIQVRHALDPIDRLRKAVEDDGGRLIVSTAPVLWQLVSADEAPQLSEDLQIEGVTPYTRTLPFDVLRQYCDYIHVPFLDVTPAFRESELGAKLFSRTAPVLSEYGTVLYARELAGFAQRL